MCCPWLQVVHRRAGTWSRILFSKSSSCAGGPTIPVYPGGKKFPEPGVLIIAGRSCSSFFRTPGSLVKCLSIHQVQGREVGREQGRQGVDLDQPAWGSSQTCRRRVEARSWPGDGGLSGGTWREACPAGAACGDSAQQQDLESTEPERRPCLVREPPEAQRQRQGRGSGRVHRMMEEGGQRSETEWAERGV